MSSCSSCGCDHHGKCVRGPRGATGSTGVIGATGATGVNGTIGSAGASGATGATGPGVTGLNARVTRTTALLLSTVPTPIPFDSDRWDNGTFWSIGNPTQLVAPEAGAYQVTGNVAANVGGTFTIRIVSAVDQSVLAQVDVVAVGVGGVNITTLVQLLPGEAVELHVFSDLDLAGSIEPVEDWSADFMIVLVGPI